MQEWVGRPARRRIEGGVTLRCPRQKTESLRKVVVDQPTQTMKEKMMTNGSAAKTPTPNPAPRGGAVLAAGRAREPGEERLAPAHSVGLVLGVSRVRKPGFARP